MARDPHPQASDLPERSDAELLGHQPDEATPSPVPDAFAHENVRKAVQSMWDVVRKGADLIVTLRQENTILLNQMSSLRKSEQDLQSRVSEFLERIDALEQEAMQAGSSESKNPGTGIDRLEDRVGELEAALSVAQQQLEETAEALRSKEEELEQTAGMLEEQTEVTLQLSQLRSELEARTQLLQELQDGFEQRDAPMAPDADLDLTGSSAGQLVVDTDDDRDSLQAELDRALQIIERYRSAGLRHLEDPDTEDQLTMFVEGKVDASTLTNEELFALSERLEGVAKRLDELFGLS